jgi:N6-adenosine-specific RNA methylase IME4
MSNAEFYLVVAGFAGFIWVGWRFDRLGKQLDAALQLIRLEMAESSNKPRENELRERLRHDRANQERANRQTRQAWITLGFIGVAAALAFWWFATRH